MEKKKGIPKILRRILMALTGLAATEAIGNGYDYIVYPAVTFWFGKRIWLSFTILFILALILNYLLVLGYDYFKRDLFGFEEIKKIKEQAHDPSVKKTWLQRRILQFERYGSVPLFLFLSWYDPFMAVLYKRRSHHFDGFRRRDYFILFISTLFACVVWSGLWSWLSLLK
jgi:hypothetical protein